MDPVYSFLTDLARSVRLADLVDVLLVALFLYAVIGWLRKSSSGSASRRVVVVGALVLGVYLLARTFQLFLVESLLRVLLFAVLIGLAVVFQSDFRRMLDRLGSWGSSRHQAHEPASRTAGLLAEAAARMAASRTGALIAVRGAEPWDSHLQGGVELDGLVSRPLLYSIFSSDTPGHDGAVLLEGDRVTRFGVHLPLSTRLPEVSRAGGTRHAAAIGLTEECDALVIVVSEERGTISVAEHGELTQLPSAGELSARLDRFWRQHYAAAGANRVKWWGRSGLENAAIASALAVGAWFLFAYSSDLVQRTFQVPIAFRNLPDDWVLEHDTLPEARVVLSGPEQAFQGLDPNDLVISFELTDPVEGPNELVIEPDDLRRPSELSVADIDPRTVSVVARRRRTAEVPIQVQTLGALPDSVTLLPDPRTVTVVLAEGDDPPDRLLTEPLDLGAAAGATSVRLPLVLPADLRLLPDQSTGIDVRIQRRAQPAGP